MVDAVLKYWPIIFVVLQAASLWITWTLRQLARTEVKAIVDAAVADLKKADRDLGAAHETLRGEAEQHHTRLTVVEEAIKGLPTRADMEKLGDAIAGVDKTLAATNATLVAVQAGGKATQDSVDRLYRFQLEQSK
jgi:hypothetical protein